MFLLVLYIKFTLYMCMNAFVCAFARACMHVYVVQVSISC